MTTSLNYGSTSLDPELDRQFEDALDRIRADMPSALGHIIGVGLVLGLKATGNLA